VRSALGSDATLEDVFRHYTGAGWPTTIEAIRRGRSSRSFSTSRAIHSAAKAASCQSANNLIHWAQIVAIDEAIRLAQGCGVAPSALRRALQDGPADSRALRELDQMRFTWYRKDIDVAQSLAASIGRSLLVAELSRRLMDSITVTSIEQLLNES
jgi:3-hydroxyisobutyrate dehydrogenase-like beta-hydroxyacid dehydrogenase